MSKPSFLACLLVNAVHGLRVPIIHTRTPTLPLDSTLVQLDVDTFATVGCKATGRALIGLVHTPRFETSAPEGACGVLCEATDAGSLGDDGLFVVRATAFARFRVRKCYDAFAPLPIFEVDPWKDAQPEDDEALRDNHDVAERRAALGALEMRCHLTFGNVAQLLSWNGPGVTSSAHLGRLEAAERAELFRAVERFAPLSAEMRSAVDSDECPVDYDEEEDEEAAAASELCSLERSFLNACVEPPVSYAVGSAGPSGRLDARELGDFQLARPELYSFALSRLHDTSPLDVAELLEGRSTAARLAAAQDQLHATRMWLGNRLGLDLDDGRAPPQWRRKRREQKRASLARTRNVPHGPTLQTRWRRILRLALGDGEQQQGSVANKAPRDGWEAMEDGVF